MLRMVRSLLLVSSITQPHSGRTNSEGRHNNRKTGSRHCHNSKSKTTTNNYSKLRSLLNAIKNTKFKYKNKTVCADM